MTAPDTSLRALVAHYSDLGRQFRERERNHRETAANYVPYMQAFKLECADLAARDAARYEATAAALERLIQEEGR